MNSFRLSEYAALYVSPKPLCRIRCHCIHLFRESRGLLVQCFVTYFNRDSAILLQFLKFREYPADPFPSAHVCPKFWGPSALPLTSNSLQVTHSCINVVLRCWRWFHEVQGQVPYTVYVIRDEMPRWSETSFTSLVLVTAVFTSLQCRSDAHPAVPVSWVTTWFHVTWNHAGRMRTTRFTVLYSD